MIMWWRLWWQGKMVGEQGKKENERDSKLCGFYTSEQRQLTIRPKGKKAT